HPPVHHPALPPLPTRRSSDLKASGAFSDASSSFLVTITLRPSACRPFTSMKRRAPVSPWRLSMSQPFFSADTSCGEWPSVISARSEEHTSELQSRENLVCRLL